MEVRGRQPGEAYDPLRRFHQATEELAQAARERIRTAREELRRISDEHLESRRDAAEIRSESGAAHEARADRVKSDRAHEAEQVERAERSQRHDRIEISQRLHEAVSLLDDDEREARVAELKALHRSGELDTPERFALAAERMLGR